MPLTAEEQFLLELINRARLDPMAEAARYGIDLNAGLPAGTLAAGSRGVLAANQMLETAALGHSGWMLATDTFSHTGNGGSAPWDRATAAGYSWSNVGENIAWSGTTAPASSINLQTAILGHHEGLFRSAGHRENLLNGDFREIGIARETGVFTCNGTNYNASMLTELFGTSGGTQFVTGVAYTDTDANRFYSMGEGVGGVKLASGAQSTTSAAAGGYSLAVLAGAAVSVTGTLATGAGFSVKLDTMPGNVKLDILNGTEFFSSGSLTLVSGIQKATLLGLNDLSLTGNGLANCLTGNAGMNKISGGNGADTLNGGGGNDTLWGGAGNDRLYGDDGNDALVGNGDNDLLNGGNGNDVLTAGLGNDTLVGGAGNDVLRGEGGNDLMTGGLQRDVFVFKDATGADVVTDYSLAQHDRLQFDDALWGGSALTDDQIVASFASVTADGVLFDFGSHGSVLLAGITTTAGLTTYLDVI